MIYIFTVVTIIVCTIIRIPIMKQKKNEQAKHCSLEVKIKLYQTYCSSIYCCCLFSVFHKRVIQKLRVAFNKIFKSLLCMSRRSSASNLFVSMNVDNFLVRRRKLTFSLFRRVNTSCNSLISCIFDSIYFNNCKLKNEWDSILYL